MTRGEALLAWYAASARDLPWRRTTDPYRVLVSEVMLQQTQAHRVADHYERFLDAFPDVERLASARLEDVLAVWSGLGYNRRALWLRDAARLIVTDGWPTTATDLQRLPGVGSYTAAAVASFAFGEDAAAVDTNVRRVVSRWLGRPMDGRELRSAAADLLESPASTWNQAVMELGATVCQPTPRCSMCPVAAWCSDPTVYEPPPPQSPFEGSARQVRAAVLRGLTSEWTALASLVEAGGWDRETVASAAASLEDDGLIEVTGEAVRLAE